MNLRLYNTLARKKEEIELIKPGEITMYNCGPTVYWRAHIGNIRAYVAWDVLHRYLKYSGLKVRRLVNFTDVGHMTSDEDFGEDKIEATARQEKKTPLDIANFFIGTILTDFHKMNILNPNGEPIDPTIDVKSLSKEQWAKLGWVRATDHIDEMIAIIEKIEANGYTYQTKQAVYFDVMKFADYTQLSGQRLSEKLEGVRDEVNVDPEKKHPADFVLWMKKTGQYADHLMSWKSPWGEGFPGWHIECTAMGTKYLGDHFDLHTGGVDHIAVHHTNEIAQNYGAFQHKVVNYWVHSNMLTSKEGDKMSKSKKNAYEFDDILARGYDPMDLRYYFLTVNYQMQMPFSLEGLDGAKSSRKSLINKLMALAKEAGDSSSVGKTLSEYEEKFESVMSDNLNTSGVLALVSDLLKSENKPADILATVDKFDTVLGLNLQSSVDEMQSSLVDISAEVQAVLDERQLARNNHDYAKSDELREKLKELGYEVMDNKVDGKDTQLVRNL
jgi:cysteinyl-tRNA synthetase